MQTNNISITRQHFAKSLIIIFKCVIYCPMINISKKKPKTKIYIKKKNGSTYQFVKTCDFLLPKVLLKCLEFCFENHSNYLNLQRGC